jgi:rhodanese-related sulfurtransferase
VVDVRTPSEYAAGHIAGAINVDVESGAFSDAIAGLDKSKTYLVYCHSGRRSGIASEQMRAAGFTVLDGGAIDAMMSRGWAMGA